MQHKYPFTVLHFVMDGEDLDVNVHPTKMGSGKLMVKAVGGGTELGGGDNVGGMELAREVSIISRSIKSSNQGWL